MPNRIAAVVLLLFSFLAQGAVVSSLYAKQGDPVALVRLPGGGIKVESMANLSVIVADQKNDLIGHSPNVSLVRTANTPQVDAPSTVVPINQETQIHSVWDRLPGETNPTWKRAAENSSPSPHAFHVHVAGRVALVAVDGVRIASVTTLDLSEDQGELVRGCDAIVMDIDGVSFSDSLSLAKKVDAKRLVLGDQATSPEVIVQAGNTLPLRWTKEPATTTGPQIVQLLGTPLQLSDELVDLFQRKEASCRESQKVFAKLSVQQMNFRPANGSHTPRWNTEHMMGRELLFFSQIYHAKDPSIPVMDLNPKQMPPDYQAKHPDWDGQEEARQMERVTAFTKRFAYLLKDMPLDKNAPGSRWTPRKLFLQMERHYSEHTANVKLKFKLPGWPAQ